MSRRTLMGTYYGLEIVAGIDRQIFFCEKGLALSSCAEVVMGNRKATPLATTDRLRQVILDTAAAEFPAAVTKLAMSMVALGDPVYGASCVGVGKGSNAWSEEELKALELGVVGGFARGCHELGIPAKLNASSGGMPNGIPG